MKRHAVSMMSPKMASFVLVCMGEVPGQIYIIYFYTVECASCAKALNKPTEVFLHAYWLCILSYTKNGQTKLEALYVD